MRILLPIVLMVALLSGCRTHETPAQQVKDAKITAELKSKLASDLGVDTITNVSVNVTNGVVTLSGVVKNAADRTKAVSIAQSVPDVVKVNDNLQVAPATG